MASKRKALCIDEKVRVIRAIERGEKKSDICRRLGLTPSTVATIWKYKEMFLQAELQGVSTKKLRKPKSEVLDQTILTWFNNERQNNVPISGTILKAKAKEFAEKLGITEFKASEGWLGKFKNRNKITFPRISGEARDVDKDLTKDWIDKVWPILMQKYSPNDIFNADETLLFYKITPNKTFEFKGEKYVEGKLSKEHITVLVAANLSGTEKRKLLVIGKSTPRCFKNLKQMPVTYKANKSAWMTSQFFEEEVKEWDAELKERKILLLVDPAHPLITNLRNIELNIFPADSIFQPMKQSVISLKSHYRKKMLMELLETDGKTSISMLQAVNFISKAWKDVTSATIQHSFRSAGLSTSQTVETEQCNREDDPPLSNCKQLSIQTNHYSENLQTCENIDKTTTASLTDEDIIDSESIVKEDRNTDDGDDQVDDSEPLPTVQQALDAAKVVETFLLFHEDDSTTSEDMSKILTKIQDKYWHGKNRQSKLTEYMCID